MRGKLAPYLAMIVLSIFASPLLITSSGTAVPTWSSKLPPKPGSTPPLQASSKAAPVQDISAPLYPKNLSLAAQSIEGGLWRTDGGFQSVMMLKNILLTTKMSVTPVLYMADGTEYDLPPVNLDKGGVAMVNLNTALQSAPSTIRPHISTYGSAGIRYQWAWKNAVGAAIRVADDGNSLVYFSHLNANANETHNTSASQVAQANEGMWWKQEPGVTCFLTMTNTSLNSITANLEVFGSGASYSTAQSVIVPPHNTTLIELGPSWGQLQGSPTEGGIRVSYTGVQGGLQLDGGLMDIAKGYSHKLSLSAMPIASSAGSTASSMDASIQAPPVVLPTINLDSTGMMIGAQDPNMQFPQGTLFAPYEVLRNTSGRAFQVQLTANYLGQSGPTDVPLGAIMLSPQEVQQVDLKDLLAAAGLGQYNGLINLRTTFVGNPSDLLAEAGSLDQTMTYVFETPPLWEAGSGGRILPYWNTAADTDTMITVWNHSSQPEDLILTFYHQQGQYKLPIHLPANGSTSLSVAALIKGGQPDSAGNVIPPTITQGSGKISSAKGDLKRLNVSLHIGVFNVRTATCYCLCAYCDPYEGQSLSPVNIAGPIGFSQPFAAYIYLSDGSYDVTSQVSWSSNDTSIAQVTGTAPPAIGVGVGQTDIGGSVFENVFDANSGSDCMSGGSFLPSGPQSEQAICGETSAPPFDCPATVYPSITSITPAQGAVGDTITVAIHGTGLTEATINAMTGITATIISSTGIEVDASFAVSPSASGGNVNVSVTANSQRSYSVTFLVLVPTSLSVVTGSVSVLPTGTNTAVDGCISGVDGDFGIKISVTYQIEDQNSNAISTHQSSIYLPQEITAANIAGQTLSRSGDIGGTRLGTPLYANTSGQFIDAPFGACVSAAFSAGSLTQTFNLLVGGTTTLQVRSNFINAFTLNSSSSGSGNITNNADISASR